MYMFGEKKRKQKYNAREIGNGITGTTAKKKHENTSRCRRALTHLRNWNKKSIYMHKSEKQQVVRWMHNDNMHQIEDIWMHLDVYYTHLIL